MLFDSSVRRELWRSFSGTLVVLLTVLLTMVLIRILSQATKGALAPTDVGLVLSYTVIGQLPVLLALALFVSVVTVLSRIWRDSEMVVWQASGARQASFIRPLLGMAWPVLLMVAAAALLARPWAQNQTQILKYRYEQRSDMARVAPGQFQVSADGKRVFFIDSHSDGLQAGRNVFMVTTADGQEAVVTANQGQVQVLEGQRFLVLTHGERTQTNLDTGEKALSRFETAKVRMGEAIDPSDVAPDMRSLPILAGLGYPTVFDVTHSVQLPGGQGEYSGGQREFGPVLARCAVAAGVHGLFIETHPEPDKAMSDGPNMIPLADMAALLKSLLKVKAAR